MKTIRQLVLLASLSTGIGLSIYAEDLPVAPAPSPVNRTITLPGGQTVTGYPYVITTLPVAPAPSPVTRTITLPDGQTVTGFPYEITTPPNPAPTPQLPPDSQVSFLRPGWSVSGTTIASSPDGTVVNGIRFVIQSDGTLDAVNATTGQLITRYVGYVPPTPTPR